MKDIIIKKYGGTSLGSIERIQAVANQIKENYKKDESLVIVVSAMGCETNNLLKLSSHFTSKPTPRALDLLLSTGEQKSIALLTIALNSIGIKARGFTGSQSKIYTNHNFNHSRIVEIKTNEILKYLDQGGICVIAGFQGVTCDGDITTLGRGGSDTTAAALAAALKAKRCEIYTDVDGVFTTNPSIDPSAKLIHHLTYDEMLELSQLGAKVLHPRAVEIASNYDFPLIVKSSFKNNAGTEINRKGDQMENFSVKGVTSMENIINLKLENLPKNVNSAHQILDTVSNNNISIDMIIQNSNNNDFNNLSFAIAAEDLNITKELCNHIIKDYPTARIVTSKIYSKISLVGIGINNHPEVLMQFLKCITKLNIDIHCLITSQMKISCLINEEYTREVISALHHTFFLESLKSKNSVI